MKKLILVFSIVLIGIACSNPQKQEEKMKTKLVDKINSVCQLTPDETNKIGPIAENFIKLRKASKDKYGNDEIAFKKANQLNRSQFMDTLKTILTPEQLEKLKAAFQQQRAKQDGGQQDGGGE
jgi:hypothetical protein